MYDVLREKTGKISITAGKDDWIKFNPGQTGMYLFARTHKYTLTNTNNSMHVHITIDTCKDDWVKFKPD